MSKFLLLSTLIFKNLNLIWVRSYFDERRINIYFPALMSQFVKFCLFIRKSVDKVSFQGR